MKPILFSTPMVQAILAGRKTQTRRIIPQNVVDRFVTSEQGQLLGSFQEKYGDCYPTVDDCQYKPGDVLWVRETWTRMRDCSGKEAIFYAANKSDYDTISATTLCDDDGRDTNKPFPWRPSIFMPREAARLYLKVTSVRAERVQDIQFLDAMDEGIEPDFTMPDDWVDDDAIAICGAMRVRRATIDAFRDLWNGINARRGYGWDSNPWVWAITFEQTAEVDVCSPK